jgi:hypothetical protein
MDKPPNRSAVCWVVTGALLLTPLFAVFDFGFGDNIRSPGLEILGAGWGWKIVYYLGMTGLGVLALWLPKAAPPIGALEAGINILVCVLAVILPYRAILDSAYTGEPLTPPEIPITALFFSGLIATLSVTSLPGTGFFGRPKGQVF